MSPHTWPLLSPSNKFFFTFVRFFLLLFQIQIQLAKHFGANLDAQNAGNGISGFQISKIFRGVYPQTPLYMRGMSATHMAFSHCLSPSSILSHIKVPFQGKSLKKALGLLASKTVCRSFIFYITKQFSYCC